MNTNIVYLTFPTDKGTNKLLKMLADIEGIKQPELLDKICRAYTAQKAIEMYEYLEKHNISIEDIEK